MPAVRSIMRASAASDYRWSSLVLGIVQSVPFQMRAAPSVPSVVAERQARSDSHVHYEEVVVAENDSAGLWRHARTAAARCHGAGMSAAATRAASRRLAVVYVPNGMTMQYWTPKGEGTTFELSPILEPLAPYRDQMIVLSGLAENWVASRGRRHRRPRARVRDVSDRRARQENRGRRYPGPASRWIRLPRGTLGNETQLASLELALESMRIAGRLRRRLQLRLHAHAIAGAARRRRCRWRTIRARCSSGCSATAAAPTRRRALARMRAGQQHSRLGDRASSRACSDGSARATAPSSTNTSTRFATSSGAFRRPKQQSERELPVVEQPAGVPPAFEDHVALMFDLQLLAFQSDLTRVITFMIAQGAERPRPYPEIGVPDAHHPLSHHQNDPEKLAQARQDQPLSHAAVRLLPRASCRRRPTATARCSITSMLLYGAGHQRQQHPHRTTTCRWCWSAAAPARSRAAGICGIRRTRRSRTCSSTCWTSSAFRLRASGTVPASFRYLTDV